MYFSTSCCWYCESQVAGRQNVSSFALKEYVLRRWPLSLISLIPLLSLKGVGLLVSVFHLWKP